MDRALPQRNLLRPWPTYLLVGLSVVVSASCVADNDEPLAFSESVAVATPEADIAAAPGVPEVTVAHHLRNAFPEHADRVLGRLHPRGFVSIDRGFARGSDTSSIAHLDVHLPKDPQKAVRFAARGGYEIRVQQVDMDGEGELAERAVAYRRARGTSFWTVTSGGAEEWLHFEEGAITSDLDVAAAWEIAGATPILMNGSVALMDDAGVARAWVSAPEAFGAEGRRVDLRLSVEGQRIELFADARGEEVLVDPSWLAVAPTTTGRLAPSLATLQSGKVLLAGGSTGAALPVDAELYDPVTNTWSAAGSMTMGRYGQRHVLLNDGRVLLAGGFVGTGYTATAERYDPTTNTWSSAGSMTGIRGYHTQVVLGSGNVLVAGGYDGTNMLASAQIYNPTTNTWSAVPDMTTGRAFATAVRLNNGKVLVAGGVFGPGSAPILNLDAELYDPATNTWSVTGSLAGPRFYATMGLLPNGQVLLAGGYGGNAVPLANAELYNPTTNTWSATGARTQAAGDSSGVALGNGQFLVVGGDDNATTVYANSDTYNPTTGTWTTAGNMNSPRSEPGITTLSGGDALVANGTPIIAFNVATNTVDHYALGGQPPGSSCTFAVQCASGFCVDGVCCTVSACAASDACHNAGTCQAGTGTCSNPAKPNGTSCNDGSACTQTDTCQGGICSGANPIICTALDICHNPGTCDPSTGVCSNPNKPNGTVCDDGNACTLTDTCQAGTCSGANPVVCSASNQCHDVGTCDPMTGMCSDPVKPDNTVCNDGNGCTQTDSCQNGVCTGANPITCMASDQCHDAGLCNPSTGACTNPPKNDGSSCNDGNACTQTDACQTGVCIGTNPVTCMASDQCHDAGLCNPSTGACTNPPKNDGSSCNDGNACTQMDTCVSGTCTGAMPVVCTASDQCHDAGTCDSMTGMCSNPAKADGTACDDNDLCTQSDACTAGTCTGSNPVTCSASDQCHDAGTCDPMTGLCSDPAKPDGEMCDDGDACTPSDTCQAGLCNGAMPMPCTAQDECHDAGTCDATTGMCDNPAKPDGTACTGGTCQAGECKLDGSGGAGGMGGAGGTGGAGEGGNAGSSAGGAGGNPTTDGGCGCHVVGSNAPTSHAAFAGLAFAAWSMLRRRRSARR